jgi:5-formaminoimidazole-4-carboxamide-1-beta-D-ribofuranosyl 5'-monophosphate synthetase
MMSDKIKETIANYDQKKIHIGVLGSHSALEIASGAQQEGLKL